MPRLVCMSDAHNLHNKIKFNIPDGDILIIAGDITNIGKIQDVQSFSDWLNKLPHKNKIVIAGNHDFCFQNEFSNLAKEIISNSAIYLENSEVTLESIKFWGSPWTPWFHNWAFNAHRGSKIKRIWNTIPEDTDILITHGPPANILDYAPYTQDRVGCLDLLNKINSLNIKVHVFGHIHNSYGIQKIDGINYINASTCTEKYDPINKPIFIDI